MVEPFKRGQVRWGDLDPVVGHEQAGRRPLLIVQNDVGNAASPTLIVVTITSRLPRRDYPFLVRLPVDTLSRPSVVNCSQVRTLDRTRLSTEPLATLTPETMAEVDKALRISLDLC